MDIELKLSEGVPSSEFSRTFVQGMADRMAMSFFKYGRVAEGYPRRVDAIKSLKLRLEAYEETGNTELLMDVANFGMIEFMHPRHPKAHFKPTDSSESPGRMLVGDINPSQASNSAGFEPPPTGWRR
jgi:hypothetical protein